MDKKDLIAFFQELRIYYGENFQSQAEILNQVEESFENNNVSKLDIKRMYRYLDKNVKKTIADDESVTDE
jgi:regulator of replication initiation timing